jgi:plasmid stability protein
MGQLIVRNLEDDLIQALKVRAARKRRSAEAEHRWILREALARYGETTQEQWLAPMADAGEGSGERPRSLWLDEETEETLREVREATGLQISEVIKRALRLLRERVRREARRRPYDIYRALDLGPGGYAIAPSTETRRGVREALRKKLRP